MSALYGVNLGTSADLYCGDDPSVRPVARRPARSCIRIYISVSINLCSVGRDQL